MKSTVRIILVAAFVMLSTLSNAQDIHFSQFNMSPLTLNPALTGAISNGSWRANGIYRNQWNSVTVPFVTFGGSFDAPIMKGIGQDDFFAAGIQFYNDRSGDGNLTNTSILASIAYHLTLDQDSKTLLSLGLQGGYSKKSVDLARLYWADEFFNGGFQAGTTGERLDPNPPPNLIANLGMSWRHQIHEKVSYFLGASAFNLNQPQESFLTKQNNEVGLPLRVSGQFGLGWQASERLMVLPAVLYQTQAAASELVAGAEFLYTIGETYRPVIAPKFFIGGYTRLNDALIGNVGMEWQGFRLGIAYDYNISDLDVASLGNGGFEIAIQYIKPGALDLFRASSVPCRRF